MATAVLAFLVAGVGCTSGEGSGDDIGDDVPPPTCGDNTCQPDEDAESCEEDCTVCGDAVCSGDETATTCSADCFVCGNDQCEGDEEETCPPDCEATLTIVNQTGWLIPDVYARECGQGWSTDFYSGEIGYGQSLLITEITAGCWAFAVQNYYGDRWETVETQFNPGDDLVWTPN